MPQIVPGLAVTVSENAMGGRCFQEGVRQQSTDNSFSTGNSVMITHGGSPSFHLAPIFLFVNRFTVKPATRANWSNSWRPRTQFPTSRCLRSANGSAFLLISRTTQSRGSASDRSYQHAAFQVYIGSFRLHRGLPQVGSITQMHAC
jgi:hypothetical protein